MEQVQQISSSAPLPGVFARHGSLRHHFRSCNRVLPPATEMRLARLSIDDNVEEWDHAPATARSEPNGYFDQAFDQAAYQQSRYHRHYRSSISGDGSTFTSPTTPRSLDQTGMFAQHMNQIFATNYDGRALASPNSLKKHQDSFSCHPFRLSMEDEEDGGVEQHHGQHENQTQGNIAYGHHGRPYPRQRSMTSPSHSSAMASAHLLAAHLPPLNPTMTTGFGLVDSKQQQQQQQQQQYQQQYQQRPFSPCSPSSASASTSPACSSVGMCSPTTAPFAFSPPPQPMSPSTSTNTNINNNNNNNNNNNHSLSFSPPPTAATATATATTTLSTSSSSKETTTPFSLSPLTLSRTAMSSVSPVSTTSPPPPMSPSRLSVMAQSSLLDPAAGLQDPSSSLPAMGLGIGSEEIAMTNTLRTMDTIAEAVVPPSTS